MQAGKLIAIGHVAFHHVHDFDEACSRLWLHFGAPKQLVGKINSSRTKAMFFFHKYIPDELSISYNKPWLMSD